MKKYTPYEFFKSIEDNPDNIFDRNIYACYAVKDDDGREMVGIRDAERNIYFRNFGDLEPEESSPKTEKGWKKWLLKNGFTCSGCDGEQMVADYFTIINLNEDKQDLLAEIERLKAQLAA